MSFIGIISEGKSFNFIKKSFVESIKEKNMNIININLQSIENVKNIKFETIIIDSGLQKYAEYKNVLKKICSNVKYFVINTDINKQWELDNIEISTITYGLNTKAMITVSSITDADMLICLQENIENNYNDVIEAGEKRINFTENNRFKVYDILIIYTLVTIYNDKIMPEQLDKIDFFTKK